jgi:hypothetical protein
MPFALENLNVCLLLLRGLTPPEGDCHFVILSWVEENELFAGIEVKTLTRPLAEILGVTHQGFNSYQTKQHINGAFSRFLECVFMELVELLEIVFVTTKFFR